MTGSKPGEFHLNDRKINEFNQHDPDRTPPGSVIVDEIATTKAAVEACSAEIISPIAKVMTGQNIFSKTHDGVVIEYVQFAAALWEKVQAAHVTNLSRRPW
jgi:hypothetical protein